MTATTAKGEKSCIRNDLIEKLRRDNEQGHASIRAKLGQVVPIPHSGGLPTSLSSSHQARIAALVAATGHRAMYLRHTVCFVLPSRVTLRKESPAIRKQGREGPAMNVG
jgi:hypothetical protein